MSVLIFIKKGRVPSGGENFFFFQSMALFTFLKSRLRIKKWFIKILTLEKLSLNNSKSADFAKTSKIVSLLRIALSMIKIFKNRFFNSLIYSSDLLQFTVKYCW